MSEIKKAMFNIAMSKSIGRGEQGQITMAAYEGETLEQIKERMNFAFDLFDERIIENNRKQQEFEEKIQAELAKANKA